MTLTNTELLFIRACKSIEPLKRIRSVYKRQYGIYPDRERHSNIDGHLVSILASLIDKKFPMDTYTLVTELAPESNYKYEGKSFAERVLVIYIHHFRYMDVNNLAGMVLPLKHRRINSW